MIYFGNANAAVTDPDGRAGSSTTISNLEANCAYGVSWTKDQSSTTLTRVGNLELHKSLPIQSQYKGCVVDLATKELKYWLKEDDWTKKADGTASKLDGTDGDVMVHIPRFYGRSYISGTKYSVYISPFYISGYQEIPECYVSAYGICTNRTAPIKARSIVNLTAEYRGGNNTSSYDSGDQYKSQLGKPRTATAISSMESYCQAQNEDMHVLSYEFYKWIFYWAYVIEYANFNCQAAFNANLTSEGYHQGGLGYGITNWNYYAWVNFNGSYPLIRCGYGNSIGNGTGLKSTSYSGTSKDRSGNTGNDVNLANYNSTSYQMPRWRGFDNPFGDIFYNLQGIIVADTSTAGADEYTTTADVYTQKDLNHYVNTSNLTTAAGLSQYTSAGYTKIGTRHNNSDGYVKEWNLGTSGGAEIIAASVGGGNTTYRCDYNYCKNQGNNGYLRSFLVGGGANSGSIAGLGFSYSHSAAAYSNTTVGFRAVLIA